MNKILPFLLGVITLLFTVENKDCIDIEQLSRVLEFASGDINVLSEEGKMYYVKDGKRINKEGFDFAFPFCEKTGLVKIGSSYGVVDEFGEFVVEAKYSKIKVSPYDIGLVFFGKGNEVRFNLLNGEFQSQYTICKYTKYLSGTLIKDANGNLVHENDKKLLNHEYDSVSRLNSGLFYAEENGRVGVVDCNNDVKIAMEYDSVQEFRFDFKSLKNHYIYLLKKGDEWHYVLNEEIVAKSKYRCKYLKLIQKEAIGVFEEAGKFSILFRGGRVLDETYDKISYEGSVAVRNDSIFVLSDVGKAKFYHAF